MLRFRHRIAVAVIIILVICVAASFPAFAYTDIASLEDIDVSKFNFPIITVNTEGNAPILNKTDYVVCGVTVSNTSVTYSLDNVLAGIRFRGNSTLSSAEKKPYRIKFDKKQDLFGMGKAKSWVLLANAFDKTMVRNAIAFSIAQELGLEYTSQFRFVNLYLNGSYEGVYLLCEQTQTGSTRVDVEESIDGKVDTGYLVELAGNGKGDGDKYFSVNPIDEPFGNGVNTNWRVNTIFGIIKTPEAEFCSPEQTEFIGDYFNDVNKAILTQNWASFNTLCDVNSFVDLFLTNIIMNNGDAGYQMYFYKVQDGGKMWAGPVWDFDQSSGGTTHCTSGYSKWYYGSTNPWFDSFSGWDAFLNIASERYRAHISAIEGIIAYYTDSFYDINAYDFHANDVRWDSVSSSYWRITNEINNLKTYEGNFEYLGTWFDNRIAWLDKNLDPVTAIDLVLSSYNLQNGQYFKLNVQLTPPDSEMPVLVWESSDESVATVDQSGLVRGLSVGSANITVSVKDTDIKAVCAVRVFEPITLTGTVTLNDEYHYGDVITPVLKDIPEGATLEYEWYSDFNFTGCTDSTYTVDEPDMGTKISLMVYGVEATYGYLESNKADITKSTPQTPDAPVIESSTQTTAVISPIDGCEYRVNSGEWQSGNTFTGLTPGTVYSFTMRYAETAYQLHSNESAAYVVTMPKYDTVAPSAPVAEEVSSTQITITRVDGCEYRINGGDWQSSNVFSELAPAVEYTFNMRYAETATKYASPESQPLVVSTDKQSVTAPEKPNSTAVLPTSVTLTEVAGCEYSMNGGAWQTGNEFSSLLPNTSYTFYIRISETETAYASPASEGLVLTTPKLTVNAPSVPVIESFVETTVTLTATDGYEYRYENGEWQTDNVFTGLTPGQTYKFTQRIAETDTSYVSGQSLYKEFELPRLTPEKPEKPEIVSKGYTNITFTADYRYEYKMDDGEWQTSPSFTVAAGTTHTFYRRVAESAVNFASLPSDGYTIDFSKPIAEKPTVPTLASVTSESILLVFEQGYEYRINNGRWQSESLFTNLLPATQYSVCRRLAETDDMYASPESDFVLITTKKTAVSAPSKPEISEINNNSITVLKQIGCEYRINDGEWQSSSQFTGLLPNTLYRISSRLAETETSYASTASENATATTLKNPAPTVQVPEAENITFNSITLCEVSGYEYSMNGGAWQSSPSFAGLLPNTQYIFNIRFAETDTQYASGKSQNLIVTTLKNTALTADAPVLSAADASSITLVAQSGCEYSINGIDWQTSNVFTGLEPATSYTFYARYAETETFYTGTQSEGTKIRTQTGITAQTFGDVKVGSWYAAYVDTAVRNGLFNGMSSDTFEPSIAMSRAMFVQVLVNLEGIDTDRMSVTRFSDVPQNKWYTGAVKWASDNNIVNGVTESEFRPNESITRQQMCTMLVRYANYKNITLLQKVTPVIFADDNRISAYAKEAVYACQTAGIVNGMTETEFAPRETATRAQVAKILSVFYDDYLK